MKNNARPETPDRRHGPELHAQLLDAVGQAVIATDLEGRVIYWNRAAEALYGWSSDEVLGRDILEVTPTDATQAQAHEIVERLRRGESWSGEFVVRRRDGSSFPAHVTDTPLFDETGSVAGLVGVSFDLTERKREEQALVKSEAQTRAILEALPDLMFRIARDGTYLDFRASDPSALVAPPETLVGRRVPELFPEALSAYIMEHITQALDAGAPQTMEYRLTVPSGEERDFEARVAPAAPDEVVVVVRDITEHKRLVASLDVERARLQEIFEQAPAFICTLRGRGHVLEMANPDFYRLVGHRDIVGRPVAEAFPELAGQPFLDLLDRVYDSGEPFVGTEMPIAFRRTPGAPPETRYVNFVYQPLREVDETVSGIFVHGVDVTPQVQARAAVEEASRSNQMIMDHSLDVICTIDRAGRFVRVSPASRRVWGYDPEELAGRSYLDFLHPEDVEQTAGAMREMLSGTAFTTLENRYLRRDGTVAHVLWSAVWSAPDGLFFAVARDVTELKAKEAALRASELRFRSLVYATAQVVWTADETGAVHELSDALTSLPGSENEEYGGWNWTEMIHPEDQPRVLAVWQYALAGKTLFETEYRLRYPDGVYRWTAVRAVPVFDPNGRFVEWVGTGTDVEARRQAEQLFRTLVEHSITGVYILQEDRFVHANPRMAELTGYEIPELMEKHPLALCHEDDRPLLAEVARRQLERGEREEVRLPFRLLRKDGSIRHVEAHGTLIEHRGRPAVLGILVDVTERVLGERELRRSEARFRSLVQNGSEIITLLDADGTVQYQSPSARRAVGYRPEEMEGRNVFELVHPEDRPGVRARLERLVAEGGEIMDEFRFRTASGEWRWLQSVASNLLDDPDVGAIVVNSRDIHERKRWEEGLVAAKEEAEEIARLKDTLLANMSHEIRTPLTAIIGFSEVLAGEAPPGLQSMAQMIRDGGERLLRTLNSVMDLAQLESKSLKLTPRQLDLVREVTALRAMFEGRAREKKLYLEVRHDAPELWASLDRGAFERVLTNLVGNALKFTRKGGVTVRLGREGDQVRIEVSDTGIGMDPAFLPRVFDDFKQESEGMKRAYEGAGLGLAITKRLVALMQGTIEVESRKGAGSTFVVRLPAGSAEAGQEPAQGSAGAPEVRLRVLAVEDQPEARLLLELLLAGQYRLTIASGGREALDTAAQERFDLVLMDINLGSGMSGEEVAAELRRRPGYAAVPIVACTAYALPGDRERYLRRGFDAYMGKPFRKQSLLELIETLCRNREPGVGNRAGGQEA